MFNNRIFDLLVKTGWLIKFYRWASPKKGLGGVMKLNLPNTDYVESKDGSLTLQFVSHDNSHDMWGQNYLFTYRNGGQDREFSVRVQPFSRVVENLIAEGTEYWKLSYEEKEDYRRNYYKKNPRKAQIIIFYSPDCPEDIAVAAGKKFYDLYFLMHASYKFNNSEYPQSGDGVYWFKLHFCPSEVDSKYWFDRTVGTLKD